MELDWLKALDTTLLETIACSGHSPLLDALMPYWRSKWLWVPLYVGLITWFLSQRRHGFLWLMVALAAVGLADFFAAGVIKPWVQRVRPCNDPQVLASCLKPLVQCGSGFSFVSAHAANHMALAVVLFLLTRGSKWRLVWLLWALSIGYGQVYVGVHYPIDVVFGFLLGAVVGYLCYRLGKMLGNRLLHTPNSAV